MSKKDTKIKKFQRWWWRITSHPSKRWMRENFAVKSATCAGWLSGWQCAKRDTTVQGWKK